MFQVQIRYHRKIQNHMLTPSRKVMGKAVARKSKLTIARECLNDHTIRNYILTILSRNINSEMHKMCSKGTNSVLKQETPETLEEFHWESLLNEVRTHASTLLYFMKACTKTKKSRPNREPTIGMCTAILLKYRYSKMSLVQKIIALILYAGHSAKQVCHDI